MDQLDFDDIERSLARVSDHLYQIHFVSGPGGFYEDNAEDICFGLNSAEFTEIFTWAESRAQDFSNQDFPRVALVDPDDVLVVDWLSIALTRSDYETLMSKLERELVPRIA